MERAGPECSSTGGALLDRSNARARAVPPPPDSPDSPGVCCRENPDRSRAPAPVGIAACRTQSAATHTSAELSRSNARAVPPPPGRLDGRGVRCDENAADSLAPALDDAVCRTQSTASHASALSGTVSFQLPPTVSVLSTASHISGPSRTWSFRVQPTNSALSTSSQGSGPSRTTLFRLQPTDSTNRADGCGPQRVVSAALTVTLSRSVSTDAEPSPGSASLDRVRAPNRLSLPAEAMDIHIDIDETTPTPRAAHNHIEATTGTPRLAHIDVAQFGAQSRALQNDLTTPDAATGVPTDVDCFAAELYNRFLSIAHTEEAVCTRIAATTIDDWTDRSRSTDKWPKAPHEHYAVRGLTALHVLVRDCSSTAVVSSALEHIDSLTEGLSELILNAEQSTWDVDGDDQDQLSPLGFHPIHIAARYGTKDVFQLLLQRVGCSELMEAQDRNGARPIHHAAANSDNPGVLTSILRETLGSSKHGGDLFVKDAWNNLPVHYAAKFATSGETARVLMRGAGRLCMWWWKQLSTANADGMCAIHCVAERHGDYAAGSVTLARTILDLAETPQVLLRQPTAVVHEGDELLAVHIAAECNAPVLKVFLDTGGPEQARLLDRHGNLPIHYAGLNEDINALKSILDVVGPAQLLEANRFGNRTIHYAAQHNRNDAVLDLILQTGGLEQLATRNMNGMEPLHCAAKRQDSATAMTLMLNCNAEVNSRDNDGVAPLDIAVRENHADGVHALLEFGADSRSSTDAGDALTVALRRLDEQIRGVRHRTRRVLFDSPKIPTDPIVAALIEHGARTTNVPTDLDANLKLSLQRAVSQTTVQSVLQRRPLRSCSGYLTPLQAARLRLAFAKATHSRVASDSVVALYLYDYEVVRRIAEQVVAKRTSAMFREDDAQVLAMQQREKGLRGEPMLPGTRVCVDGDAGVVELHVGEADDLSSPKQRVRFSMHSVKMVALDAKTRDPKTWVVLPSVVFEASEAHARGISLRELSQKYEYYMNTDKIHCTPE